MLSTLVYVCGLVIMSYLFLDITWRIWKRKFSFLPSAPNIPWLGTLPYFTDDICKMHERQLALNTKHNHLFVSWIGPIPQIHIGSVEYIEPLLKSDAPKVYDILRDWLGDGLLTATTGPKWKKRRTALNGVFHYGNLSEHLRIYEAIGRQLVDKLRHMTSRVTKIEIQWLMGLVALDGICESSMGIKINAINASNCPYVDAVRDIRVFLRKRISNSLYFNETFFRFTRAGREYYKNLSILHKFTVDIINERISARRKHPHCDDVTHASEKKRVIDLLLDLYDKGEIDIDGIREEVDTLMFAGHDTTSCALSWTLYEIGRHPEIQKKLYDEIRNVASKDCSFMEKMVLLRYMDCVVKECLRMYPPVFAIGRILKNNMVITGHVMPKGTIMMVDVYSVHRNPAYWDNPTRFDPNRFERDEKRREVLIVTFRSRRDDVIVSDRNSQWLT